MKRLLLVLLAVSCDAPPSSSCQIPDELGGSLAWIDACVEAIGSLPVTACCEASASRHLIPSTAEELCNRLSSTKYNPVEVLSVEAIAACVEQSEGNACNTHWICGGYLERDDLLRPQCEAFPVN